MSTANNKHILKWNRPATNGSTPYAVCAHTMTFGNNKFYVFGGWNGLHMRNDLYVLDPETMIWTRPNTIGSIPKARAGHSCTYIPHDQSIESSLRSNSSNSDKLLVLGGGDGENFLNDVHILDIETMTWKTLYTAGNSPSPRSRHTATLVNNLLYVIGGGGDNSAVFNDVYTLDLSTMKWNKPLIKGSPPNQRWGHTSLNIGPYIYIFGGYDGSKMLNDVHILNTETLSWELPRNPRPGEVVPSPRAGHASCFISIGKEKKMLVFGGGDGEKVFNDTYLYDIVTNTWNRLNIKGPLPAARCAHTCNHYNGRIYVFGGSDISRRFKDVYTLDTNSFCKSEESPRRNSIKKSRGSLLNSSSKISELSSSDESLNPVDTEFTDEKKTVNKNNGKDIITWLASFGMEKYADNFISQEIDMSVVHYLDDESLIAIGIDKLGARLRILHAIKQLPSYKTLPTKNNVTSISNEILITNIKTMKELGRSTEKLISAILIVGNSLSDITTSLKNKNPKNN